MQIAQETANRPLEASVEMELGMITVLEGQIEVSLVRLRRAAALLQESVNATELSRLLCHRAHAEYLNHTPDAARTTLHDGRRIADDINDGFTLNITKTIASLQALLDDTVKRAVESLPPMAPRSTRQRRQL